MTIDDGTIYITEADATLPHIPSESQQSKFDRTGFTQKEDGENRLKIPSILVHHPKFAEQPDRFLSWFRELDPKMGEFSDKLNYPPGKSILTTAEIFVGSLSGLEPAPNGDSRLMQTLAVLKSEMVENIDYYEQPNQLIAARDFFSKVPDPWWHEDST